MGRILFALKYKEIGLKIAYYRKKKGYTQAQLAEKIGISSNYLSLIECGNKGNSYSMETLFKIAEALDINKDSNIDIGEYATSTLVADMLSSDNTKLKKENITGTINNQGENSSLAYINSKNKAVASAEFKAIYDDFKLDEATKDFLSDPNNTVI